MRTWADTYAELLPEEFYSQRLGLHRRRDWEAVIRDQERRGGGVTVARCARGLAGLCQYGPSEDPDDDPQEVAHIHRLYVHPACQRRGVGGSLLADVAARRLGPGVTSLSLWVLEADPRARAFYERLGWQPDGARRFDGAADVRYRRAAEATRPS